MKTIRLTTAQALVRWLLAQRTVIEGDEVGDLCRRLRHLRAWQRDQPGRSARARPGPAPDLARSQRAVDGPRRRRLCEGHARTADHDRHLVRRTRFDELRDRRRGRACQSASGPAPLGRHVPASDRRSRPPAGRALQRPDDDRHGCVQARHPLLGPDHSPRADRAVPATGAGGDARSGHPWPCLPRPAAGHPGGGLRLPGRLLRTEGPLHPPSRTGPPRHRGRRQRS